MTPEEKFLLDKRLLRAHAEAALAQPASPLVQNNEASDQALLQELQLQQVRLKEITAITQGFIYDLRVHEIELEIQNESLREAQSALEVSRDRYADLYEFAPVGYMTLNSDGMIEEINLTATAMLGMERSLLLRTRFTALVIPDDQPFWMSLFLRVKKQATAGRSELSLLHGDGLPIQVQVDCKAKENPYLGPGSTSVRVVLQDITARKQAEEKLRFAASVFSHAHEGIIITKTDGSILDVNAAFTAITGYSREEALGKNPRLLNSGHHERPFFVGMWKDMVDKGQWSGEIWNRRKNGEVYAQFLTITVVPGENGLPQHYIGLFSDISAQKASETLKTL